MCAQPSITIRQLSPLIGLFPQPKLSLLIGL
jgi:hypothetical protein